MYFKLEEQAVWRNLAAWKGERWVRELMSAPFWSGYDFAAHGWTKPTTNHDGFKCSFLLVYSDEFKEAEWAQVVLGNGMVLLVE